MAKKVSAADVARKAGVSRTTVSFVLNNAPGKIIPEETRQRILHAARELAYRPDELARKLAMTKHHAIGLYVSHTHSFYADAYIIRFVEGMATVLNRYRFQLVIESLRVEESRYLQMARSDGLEGIILINLHGQDEGLNQLMDSGFPLVVIGRVGDPGVPQVDIDNLVASQEVVTHLADLGHRRIGMITHAPLVFSAARERLDGYRRALEDRGLERREEWVRIGDFSEESGYAEMQRLLALPDPPTAVFAGNDMVAFGAMKAAKDAGLRIPADVSLAGFDDDFLSRYLNPPLTTMSLPAASLGARAAKHLIQLLVNELPEASRRLILSTRLAVRGSTASPPR